MNNMKSFIILVGVLLLVGNVMQFLNPQIEVKVKKEYIKGDTIRDTVSVVDTVYFDKIIKVKADTVEVSDEGIFAKSKFDLSNDTVSVSGVVSYEDSVFSFNEIRYLFPKVTETVTRIDTILQETTIRELTPFYFNEWFWAFIGVLVTFVATMSGAL